MSRLWKSRAKTSRLGWAIPWTYRSHYPELGRPGARSSHSDPKYRYPHKRAKGNKQGLHYSDFSGLAHRSPSDSQGNDFFDTLDFHVESAELG
jgi:hypothetical protein